MRSVRSVHGAPAAESADVVEIGDAALVHAARAGDRKAEERLVLRHAPAIAAVAARLSGSRQDAEDVTQDALIAALTSLPRLREPAAFRAWAIRIAVLKVRALLRRRRIARALGLDVVVPDVTLQGTAAPNVSGEVRAELALLDRVLERLPADLRIAWMLRHVEGLELEEVADACGCSVATIKRRVAAASAKVAEHVTIEDQGER